MNVLITGGNGYIAKSIYSSLMSQYDVTCVSRHDFDLTDSFATAKYFSNKYFDVVIHTAVVGGRRLDPEDSSTMDQNLQIYYNLLACKNKFNKFIYFGSGAEIHFQNTFYGLSKHIIKKSIQGKNNFYNLRIFAVFDENELETRFIKNSISNCIQGKDIEIHQDKFMDFIYMKDLIDIVKYYIENDDLKQTIDCCYKEKYKLSDIANYINELFCNKHRVIFLKDGLSAAYTGTYADLPINFIGLREGIIRTKLSYGNKLHNKQCD